MSSLWYPWKWARVRHQTEGERRDAVAAAAVRNQQSRWHSHELMTGRMRDLDVTVRDHIIHMIFFFFWIRCWRWLWKIPPLRPTDEEWRRTNRHNFSHHHPSDKVQLCPCDWSIEPSTDSKIGSFFGLWGIPLACSWKYDEVPSVTEQQPKPHCALRCWLASVRWPIPLLELVETFWSRTERMKWFCGWSQQHRIFKFHRQGLYSIGLMTILWSRPIAFECCGANWQEYGLYMNTCNESMSLIVA